MKNSYQWRMAGLAAAALAIALILITSSRPGLLAQGSTIYVDADATGANDGTSWANAYVTLQPALEAASDGDEVWVAAGVYTPTVEHGGTGGRYKSFQMKNGVALYGDSIHLWKTVPGRTGTGMQTLPSLVAI